MQSIVGTWKLLHATARDVAGAARPLPYGGKALGRLTLTADGRMMSVVCDGRTELPAGVRREYSSYCGNYTYDGERLVTRVDAASDPTRIGSDQVRGVRFEGERMVLIPPPCLTGESEEHREITWERIAAGAQLVEPYVRWSERSASPNTCNGGSLDGGAEPLDDPCSGPVAAAGACNAPG